MGEVIDASNQFMTYFNEAYWKAMGPAESIDVDEAEEAKPAVAAVKSVDVKPSPAVVIPSFYNFPAFTYPITPLKYFLLPVTAPVVPQAVAAEAPAVEEA